MTSQYSDMKSSSNFFVVLFLLLSLVNYPSFMSILSLVLELWQFFSFIRNIKFGTNVSNKMLLNAAKCQGYNFYRFLYRQLLRENQQGEGVLPTVPPPSLHKHTHTLTQIRVKFKILAPTLYTSQFISDVISEEFKINGNSLRKNVFFLSSQFSLLTSTRYTKNK